VLCLVPAAANAAEIVAGDEYFSDMTWKLYSDGVLTITGEGSYASSSWPWADYALQIRELYLDCDVMLNQRGVFVGYPNLTRVVSAGGFSTINVEGTTDAYPAIRSTP
jgi:hypothetical protein